MPELRITLVVLKILEALYADDFNTLYGLQLAQQTSLSNGALYPALNKLVACGLVSSMKEQGDESALGRRNRRYFSLTSAGKHLAEQELAKAPGFTHQQRLAEVPAASMQGLP